MAIAQLSIDMVAKMATFERDLKRSVDLTKKQTDMMSGAFGAVKTSIAGMASAFTVGFLVDFVKRSIDSVDALNDLRDATGASIENLSALEDIAGRTGTTMDTVSSAMIKFNAALKDAKPDSQQAKAFGALNLDIAELKRLDPAEALLKVATAFAGFADDGNKARIMQELFGKSLKDVAPFLKDLADKGELVAKVTTQQAEEAEKFNKELFAMQKNVQDLSREITGPLVSAFNAFIEKQREAKKNGKFGLFTSPIQAELEYNATRYTGSWGDPVGNAGRGNVNPELARPTMADIGSGKTGGGKSTVAKKTQEQIDKEKALAAAIRDKSAAEEEFFASVMKADEQYQSLLNRLLAATPIQQLESQRDDMRMLATELEQGRISEALYLEAVTARLNLTAEKIDLVADKTDKAKTAADEFGMTMASAFEDAIIGGKDFGTVLDGLVQDILRMSIRKAVTDPMSNIISAAIGTMLPSFAVGTNYVPQDMVAQIHKGERIVPAAQNTGQGGGQPITVIQNFTVGDVASISMVRQAVAGSERRIAAGIGRSMTYGGALA